MADEQKEEWILETIDQLRKRKARPDLERICHMLERKHGRSFHESIADIERLVEKERIVKVDYKGSTSYRNAAKWRRNHSGNGNGQDAEALNKIKAAIRALSVKEERDGAAGKGGGALAEDIEKWLLEQDPSTSLVDDSLLLVLGREVSNGKLELCSDKKYTIKVNKKEVKSPAKTLTKTETKTPTKSKSAPTKDGKVTSPGSEKKKRLSNSGNTTKRKRFKKSHGPDFESYDVVKSSRSRERSNSKEKEPTPAIEAATPTTSSMPPEKSTASKKSTPVPAAAVTTAVKAALDEDLMGAKCDYCLLTSTCNRNGEPEELLICKDCQAKAHPSCMDYSQELARRACNSPWQCIDCKTCYICEDSGDADEMLFCDACDKGYHMNCHDPPIQEKPTGKWVCSQCVMELGEQNDTTEISPESEAKKASSLNQTSDAATAGLPTPSASPVQFTSSPPESKSNNNMTNGVNTYTPSEVMKNLPRLADTLPKEVPDASEWTIQNVVQYFSSVGFVEQAEVFSEQEIDGKSLLLMKRSDVLTGLSLKLGPALKIYTHVQRLQMHGQQNL